MAILVTCPNCQVRLEIADDMVDQPVRCHHCMHVFERGGARERMIAVGIHAGAPHRPPTSIEDDGAPEPLARAMARPRPAFPWSALYLVVIGLLFFLLVVSVGFNVWVVLNDENRRHRDDDLRAMQQQLQAQQFQAQANADLGRQQELQAAEAANRLQRQNEDLKRQVEILRGQLEEAQGKDR